MQSACGFSVESFKAAHWSNAEGFSFHFRNFRASDAWYFDLIVSLRVEQPSAFTTPLALTLPRHYALALCIARYHYLCQFYHSQYTQRWEQNPSAKGVNFHIQYFQCSTITADIIWNIPCLYCNLKYFLLSCMHCKVSNFFNRSAKCLSVPRYWSIAQSLDIHEKQYHNHMEYAYPHHILTTFSPHSLNHVFANVRFAFTQQH